MYGVTDPHSTTVQGDAADDLGDDGGEKYLQGRHVTLVTADGVTHHPPREHLERMRDGRTFFWLDVHEPLPSDVSHLADVMRLHPLVLEDLAEFGQRPKVDTYGDHALVVAFGASTDDDQMVEVHSVVGPTWLITLHRDDCVAFPPLYRRIERGARPAGPLSALYRVLDALTDSFFPLLEGWDERVDEIQNEIFAEPRDAHMREVFAVKRRLIGVRKVVSPQRDVFAQLAAGTVDLPALDQDSRRYFRDVYDHMIRLADMVDTQRDLLTGVIDVYLGMVGNRRDQVMKQLTLIATIFMPLTFITGFFGMNFGWMVDHIGSWWGFAVATLAQLGVLVGALVVFRRRGWM